MTFPRRRSDCFVALVVLAIGPPARGADLYFMTVYGAQRPVVNQPRYSHTWATFVRLTGNGPDPRRYTAQTITISWLPETLEVRPLELRAEPGVNLTQQQTAAWCEKYRMEIAQFGPYQIEPRLWELAFRRFDRLERGELMYRASDLFSRPNKKHPEVCNCIYAVLDLDGRDPAFRPVTLGFGYIGSAFVTRRLSPYIIDPDRTHPWVAGMSGTDNYPDVRPGLARAVHK